MALRFLIVLSNLIIILSVTLSQKRLSLWENNITLKGEYQIIFFDFSKD